MSGPCLGLYPYTMDWPSTARIVQGRARHGSPARVGPGETVEEASAVASTEKEVAAWRGATETEEEAGSGARREGGGGGQVRRWRRRPGAASGVEEEVVVTAAGRGDGGEVGDSGAAGRSGGGGAGHGVALASVCARAMTGPSG